MIGFVTGPPLMDGMYKKVVSDKANYICIEVKGFLIKSFTFFALLNIKAFGRLSLDTMLLLIGLAHFYNQAVFV